MFLDCLPTHVAQIENLSRSGPTETSPVEAPLQLTPELIATYRESGKDSGHVDAISGWKSSHSALSIAYSRLVSVQQKSLTLIVPYAS